MEEGIKLFSMDRLYVKIDPGEWVDKILWIISLLLLEYNFVMYNKRKIIDCIIF